MINMVLIFSLSLMDLKCIVMEDMLVQAAMMVALQLIHWFLGSFEEAGDLAKHLMHPMKHFGLLQYFYDSPTKYCR